MSLKDRLGRLTGEPVKPVQADPKQERLSELRKRIEEVMNRKERLGSPHVPQVQGRSVPIEHVVTGDEAATEHGRFFISRSTLKADDFHGHTRVRDFACSGMHLAAILAG